MDNYDELHAKAAIDLIGIMNTSLSRLIKANLSLAEINRLTEISTKIKGTGEQPSVEDLLFVININNVLMGMPAV